MADTLPVRYMRTIRDLTGFWGTYPPTRALEPGTIGNQQGGVFETQGQLVNLPGIKAADLKTDDYEADEATMEWRTSGVTSGALAPDVSAPGNLAKAAMNLSFSKQGDALLLCRGIRHHVFTDLRAVKKNLFALKEKGKWNADDCLVTEVMHVDAAWIFFATGDNQSASLKATMAAPPAALPGSLKSLVGDANLKATLDGSDFKGFSLALPNGGAPLFSALRFSRAWWQLGLGGEELVSFVKGPGNAFEEPDFG